jgi:hypothetical protein
MSVPSPAVPATTVKAVNTTGQYVYVALTGGTTTFIYTYDQQGNQTQVGTTTPQNVLLPPGYSISVTYSAAPSWAWTDPYGVSDYPPVYSMPNLITAQASPNGILAQLPGNIYAPTRSLAGGSGCWAGTSSATGLAVGVSN